MENINPLPVSKTKKSFKNPMVRDLRESVARPINTVGIDSNNQTIASDPIDEVRINRRKRKLKEAGQKRSLSRVKKSFEIEQELNNRVVTFVARMKVLKQQNLSETSLFNLAIKQFLDREEPKL